MITNFVFLLCLTFCLGGLLPRLTLQGKPSVGLIALGGFSVLTCFLYVGIVLLCLGLEFTLYAVIALGLTGLFVGVRKGGITSSARELLVHPIVVLPVAICLVSVAFGPHYFAAYGDDTFMNWLAPAKQMWLVDDHDDPRIFRSAQGYLPGWHFLLAFTSPLFGEFSETRAVAVPLVFHIVFLAAAFDVTRAFLVSCHFSPLRLTLIAYIILLLLLSAEASWQLVPTLVLSEMPLIYSLIGAVLLGGLLFLKDFRNVTVLLYLSLLLCTHYLIKSQGIAVVPVISAMVLFASMADDEKNGKNFIKSCGVVLAVLLPFLVVLISWNVLGPEPRSCSSKLDELLAGGLNQFGDQSNWKTLAADLFAGVWAYLVSYKWPITLVAIAGLAGALLDRSLRWIALATFIYAIVYLIAVYWSYLSCPDSFNAYLSSLPRYLQLPVRLFQFIGLLLLAIGFLRLFCPSITDFSDKHSLRAACGVILVLGIYQITEIDRAFRILKNPDVGEMKTYAYEIPKDVSALETLIRSNNLPVRKVLMMFTFIEDLPFYMGFYHSLHRSPDQIRGGGPLSAWQLTYLRYNKKTDRYPVHRSSLDMAVFEGVDIIWPMGDAVGISAEILRLSGNTHCAEMPTDFFLVRSEKSDTPFVCYLKSDYVGTDRVPESG